MALGHGLQDAQKTMGIITLALFTAGEIDSFEVPFWVVLAAAGVWAGRSWAAKTDVPTTVGLSALYVAAFGASHPLAKKMGSWPAVLTVTAAASGAAYALADAK